MKAKEEWGCVKLETQSDAGRLHNIQQRLPICWQIRQNQQSKLELCEHNFYVTERRGSQRWREREMADREHYRGTLDRGEVK